MLALKGYKQLLCLKEMGGNDNFVNHIPSKTF